VGRGAFLGGQLHLYRYRKGPGPKRNPILGFPSIYVQKPFVAEPPNLTMVTQQTHMARGLVLDGRPRSHPKWAGSQRSPILGFLSIYAHVLRRRTTNSDVVTLVGEGRVCWGQPRLPSQESGVPALPNFVGSRILMPTPFNAYRPNSA